CTMTSRLLGRMRPATCQTVLWVTGEGIGRPTETGREIGRHRRGPLSVRAHDDRLSAPMSFGVYRRAGTRITHNARAKAALIGLRESADSSPQPSADLTRAAWSLQFARQHLARRVHFRPGCRRPGSTTGKRGRVIQVK